WQWLFWFNLPLVGIALYRLARFQFVQSSRKSEASIDVAGLILFPSMMTLIIYWLSAGGHYFPWFSVTSISLVSAFVLTSLLFIAQQKRVTASFLPLRLLARREIHIPLLSTFIFAACLFALIFFLPIFLQLGLRVNAAQSGLLLIPLSCGIIGGAYTTGKVIAKT
ncbi:TPA: MFS transporter, partial [Vibrio cholerae O1]